MTLISLPLFAAYGRVQWLSRTVGNAVAPLDPPARMSVDYTWLGSSMQGQSEIGLRVLVDPASVQAGPGRHQWLVTWCVRNLSDQPLQLLAARLPHPRFRSEERELALKLSSDESTTLELEVTSSESADAVVDNVFLILRVLWGDQPWRVLARLRVVFAASGAPETVTEVVTVQPVGFSLSTPGGIA